MQIGPGTWRRPVSASLDRRVGCSLDHEGGSVLAIATRQDRSEDSAGDLVGPRVIGAGGSELIAELRRLRSGEGGGAADDDQPAVIDPACNQRGGPGQCPGDGPTMTSVVCRFLILTLVCTSQAGPGLGDQASMPATR